MGMYTKEALMKLKKEQLAELVLELQASKTIQVKPEEVHVHKKVASGKPSNPDVITRECSDRDCKILVTMDRKSYKRMVEEAKKSGSFTKVQFTCVTHSIQKDEAKSA